MELGGLGVGVGAVSESESNGGCDGCLQLGLWGNGLTRVTGLCLAAVDTRTLLRGWWLCSNGGRALKVKIMAQIVSEPTQATSLKYPQKPKQHPQDMIRTLGEVQGCRTSVHQHPRVQGCLTLGHPYGFKYDPDTSDASQAASRHDHLIRNTGLNLPAILRA